MIGGLICGALEKIVSLAAPAPLGDYCPLLINGNICNHLARFD
jgi:hypothetical protein